jgi:S-methylmethionine-dependent homocysteine/selenocysteine methylase
MSKYRRCLPQLDGGLILTDGGIETTLVFHEGVTLPYFASFDLLKDQAGTAILRRYFARYAELARASELGIVLETPTWRANASRRSHKELDESPDLDEGDPEELGREYRELRGLLRNLSVVGGCCGTDHRHVAAIAGAMSGVAA